MKSHQTQRLPICTRLRWFTLTAVLCAAVGISACKESRTAVDLTVAFDDSLSITRLRIVVALANDPSQTKEQHWPDQANALKSGARVLLLIADQWAGQQIDLTVAGLVGMDVVAQGAQRLTIAKNEVQPVALALATSCPGSCELDVRECAGDGFRACVEDSDGCPRWTAPTPCPSNEPFCSGGVCASVCQDECANADDRRCATDATADISQGRQICGNYDSDDCLEWGQVIACNDNELCVSGRCLLGCNGAVCECQPGETKACPDQGQCSSDDRSCVNGTFDECDYQIEPELCNGLDDDCDDAIDNGLAPSFCGKKDGVCSGALETCDGVRGWTPCTDDDYEKHASAQGLTYTPTVDACDGQDNDCDNSTDEDADCGANRQCTDGTCVCSFASCSGNCCAAGEVCHGTSGACCAPTVLPLAQCGDDGCDNSSGNCQVPLACTPQQQCRYEVLDLVSRDNGGQVGNAESGAQRISSDGSVIVYHSKATNLDPSGVDTSAWDIFRTVLPTNGSLTTSRISILASGGPNPNGDSMFPDVSEDGCTVVFQSTATQDLTTDTVNDTNGASDAFFVQECGGGAPHYFSLPSQTDAKDAVGNGASTSPHIIQNGPAAFVSTSTNFAPRVNFSTVPVTGAPPPSVGGEAIRQIYRFSGGLGNAPELLSFQDLGGSEYGYGSHSDPGIAGHSESPDGNRNGNFVIFQSDADNLGSMAMALADDGKFTDIFIIRLNQSPYRMNRISEKDTGSGADGNSINARMSADDDFVVFQTEAPNLAGGVGTWRVVLWERACAKTTSCNTFTLVADRGSTRPSVSDDGDFVAFESQSPTLPGSGSTSRCYVWRRSNPRVMPIDFREDGSQPAAACQLARISSDGAYISFRHLDDLVGEDNNGAADIYRVPNPLF